MMEKTKEKENWLTLETLKALGFIEDENGVFTQYSAPIHGSTCKLIFSRVPLNVWAMFILSPDGCKTQFFPQSTNDIKTVQRLFAHGYYDNPAQAWITKPSE